MHLYPVVSLSPCSSPAALSTWPRRFARLTALSGAALVLAAASGCAAQQPSASASTGVNAAAAGAGTPAHALQPPQRNEVVRHGIPGSSFPIAAAVEVPGSATTVYLSGTVPPRVDSARPDTDRQAYGGDTRAQTLGVLRSIESQLKNLGLGMGDIVKMQVFLVADAKKGNTMDFDGFMAGYTQFFGTAAQPRLPVRSAFQIAALANPAWLVEIEVTAVRPAAGTAPMPALPGAAAGGR